MKWLLVILLCCGAAFGQSYTFQTIVFEGASQYSQAELLGMSGLSTGKTMSKADLEAALHKLDDTGLFAEINYKTDGPVLHLKLEPIGGAQERKVRYANFVVSSPEELNSKVHQRLPAFMGAVPQSGPLTDQVARALEAILLEQGIHATVSSVRDQTGGMEYSIMTPPVVIGKVLVTGVDFGKDQSLEAIRDRFAGDEYLEESSGEALRKNLTDAYQDLGYVDFAPGPVHRGAPVVKADKITVDLQGEAQVGPLYRIAQVTMPAVAPRIAGAEMERADQLKVGAPASRIEVMSTEARVNQVFQAHGYLDEKTGLDTSKDAAAHTMTYAFHTDAGEAYKFRALKTAGLGEAQAAEVRKAVTLTAGSYFEQAGLVGLTAPRFRTMCDGKPVASLLEKVPATHEVDVTLGCRGAR